jgi:hypothetical protein
MSQYALAGTLKVQVPVEAVEARLAEGFHETRPYENDPDLILVTEVSDPQPEQGGFRFRLRWDQALQREDENGTVWERDINRVTVTIKRVAGEPLLFIHGASRLQCTESRGSTSRVIAGANGQIVPLKPGSPMFHWIETQDAVHLIGAGVRRPQGTGIRNFRLGGDFDVDDAEWATIRDSGLVVYLRYESHDGNTYAVYTDGTVYGDGPDMTSERLETYVITKVLPHLSGTSRLPP